MSTQSNVQARRFTTYIQEYDISPSQNLKSDENEEGFFAEYEPARLISESPTHKIADTSGRNNKDNQIAISALGRAQELEYNRIISEKDQQIRNLEQRIQMKDENLSYLTTGYENDLRNLKENIFKKEASNIVDYEFFEMPSIDSSTPETLKVQVSNKVRDLKNLFEKTASDLVQKIFFLNSQLQQLKQRKNRGYDVDSINVNESSIHALMSKIFLVEPNPYKFWKIIQDLKGNRFIFEVFENQKTVYGINYQEINHLLLTSKAADRELKLHKKNIDEQFTKFVMKINAEIQTLKEEYTYKQREFANFQTKQKQIQEQTENSYRTLYAKKMFDREQYYLSLAKKQSQDQSLILKRYFLKLWKLISVKTIHIDDLANVFLNTRHHVELQKYLSLLFDQNRQMEAEDLSKKMMIDKLNIQVRSLEEQNVRLKNEIYEVQSSYLSFKKQMQSSDSQLSILLSCYNQIAALFDGRTIIYANDTQQQHREKSENLREFIKSITSFDRSQTHQLIEIQEQYDKNTLGYAQILKAKSKVEEKQTLTQIFGLNKELQVIDTDINAAFVANKFLDTGVQTDHVVIRSIKSEKQIQIDSENLGIQIENLNRELELLRQQLRKTNDGQKLLNEVEQSLEEQHKSLESYSQDPAQQLKQVNSRGYLLNSRTVRDDEESIERTLFSRNSRQRKIPSLSTMLIGLNAPQIDQVEKLIKGFLESNTHDANHQTHDSRMSPKLQQQPQSNRRLNIKKFQPNVKIKERQKYIRQTIGKSSLFDFSVPSKSPTPKSRLGSVERPRPKTQSQVVKSPDISVNQQQAIFDEIQNRSVSNQEIYFENMYKQYQRRTNRIQDALEKSRMHLVPDTVRQLMEKWEKPEKQTITDEQIQVIFKSLHNTQIRNAVRRSSLSQTSSVREGSVLLPEQIEAFVKEVIERRENMADSAAKSQFFI